MLAREALHMQKMQQACHKTNCLYDQWESLVAQAKALPYVQRLQFINREVNRTPYIVDPQNWNSDDYWETPYEFFIYSGDCEDFAITKYLALKASGFSTQQMRIVVLQDLNLNLLHSVLAVQIDNTTYILDNQFQQVMKDEAIHHYQPIYSINEYHWWRHVQ